MNLVEQFIKEILSEKIEINPYTNKPCYVVRLITNCCGYISEVEQIFDTEEWEQAKIKGCYMA